MKNSKNVSGIFSDVRLRTQMCVKEKDMDDWKMICKRWCDVNNAKLLFVRSDSFGCELPDGQFKHIYVEELVELLGGKIENFA